MLPLAECRPLPQAQMIEYINQGGMEISENNFKAYNSPVTFASTALPERIRRDIAINLATANGVENISAADLAYGRYNTASGSGKFLKVAPPANCPCFSIKAAGPKQPKYKLNPNHLLLNNLVIPDADINAQDDNGYTALMIIVTDPNAYDLLKDRLTSKRPNVNLRNAEGNTALHLAIKHKAYENAQLLIDHGADINLDSKNENGKTPIMMAAVRNNRPIIEKLIEKRASLDIRDSRGQTALILAIKNRSIENAEKLIQAGANVNLADHKLYTPLMYAIQKNMGSMVQLLLSKNVMVNIKNKQGYTPFLLAIEYSDLDICKLLSNQAIHISATNNAKETALMIAKRINDVDKINWLKGIYLI